MSTFLKNFNNVIVDKLIEDLDANTTNYYVFAGKFKEWEDDEFPPNADLSLKTAEFDLRNDILFGKKITSADSAKMIRKVEWEANTTYDFYDHRDPDLFQKDFFVVNSANNVYKCLFNNNDEPSMFEPGFVSTEPVRTADGYLWKYMYTIEPSDANRFATDDFIPISPNTDIETSAVGGTIEVILVDDGGVDYEVFNIGTIQTVVSNTVFRIDNSAAVSNGFYTDSAIYIETGTGAGSISEIVNYVSNTSGKFITTANSLILDTTSEYIISPRVVVNGDGSGIVAYSTVDTTQGVVDQIFVQNTGSDYTFADIQIIANTIHGSGATAEAIISPLRGHGADPANELGADKLAITVNFTETESNTIPAEIDFRQAGIIRGVENFANTDLYEDSTFNHTVKFDTNYIAGTPFSNNEIVTGTISGAKAEIINVDLNTAKAQMITVTAFISGETVISDSGIQASITNLSGRDINKYSGEIMYYTNFSPLTRQELSSETVKLIIRI